VDGIDAVHASQAAMGYALRHLKPKTQSGQFICSKTGQVYLLSTRIDRMFARF